jgi:hypothetical protein
VSLEVIAIVLTVIVHFIGAIVLIWAITRDEEIDWLGILRPGDDDGGGGGPGFEPPRSGDGGGGGDMLILPPTGAGPSSVRLREPGRIADAHPRPARRPAHTPERAPVREPAGR